MTDRSSLIERIIEAADDLRHVEDADEPRACCRCHYWQQPTKMPGFGFWHNPSSAGVCAILGRLDQQLRFPEQGAVVDYRDRSILTGSHFGCIHWIPKTPKASNGQNATPDHD